MLFCCPRWLQGLHRVTSAIAKTLLLCYVLRPAGCGNRPVDLRSPDVASQLVVRDVEVLQRVKLDVTKDMHTFNPVGLLEVKERRAAKRARTATRLAGGAAAGNGVGAHHALLRPQVEPLPQALAAPMDGVARRGWFTTEGYWATRWAAIRPRSQRPEQAHVN